MLSLALVFSATVPASAGMRGRMLHLINGARRSHGEHPLRLSIPVSRAAHHHSRLMADRGYLFHTANLQQVLSGRPWSVFGENIARAKTVRSTFRAWMRSPGHRANILRARYKRIGIGIEPRHRALWSTIDFWG
jgi:uncharacterized protein YkwD